MKYTKSDHSSLEGERYEIRLAALIFLLCKRSESIARFQLATNAKVGMKLDDVVLKYETVAEPGVWHTWFLQLKKKTGRKLTDTALTGDSADFGLKAYVGSHVHIKKGMSADNREGILNGSWENCHFGLYTNVEAEGKLLDRRASGPFGELETLLQSLARTPIVLGFREERDAIIFNALGGDADGREFVEKVKVFPGQPTPDELESIIKGELRARGDVPEESVDFLYHCYEKRVERWWGEWTKKSDLPREKENDLLDETSDIYDLAVGEARSRHVTVTSSREVELACHDVRFADLATLERDFDDSVALVHVITSEPSLRASCTKLVQYVRGRWAGQAAFFRLELLRRQMETVLPVWRSDGKLHRLVVLSDSGVADEDSRELADRICDILQGNKNKRITVVSRRCDGFTSYLKTKLCSHDFTEIEDECRVLQLGEECLGKLMDTRVSFQGCVVDIKSFFDGCDGSLEDIVLDDGVLGSLNSKRTLSIGRAPPEDESWYISRTLQSLTVLREDVLRADLAGTLAVSGVTLGELQGLIPAGERAGLLSEVQGGRRFVVLTPDHAENEWRELREVVDTAHWIHRQGGQLVVKESKGCVDELRPHVDPTSHEVDDCLDVPQRAVLVVGEPGMGKTTLASHLARRTKRAHPTHWVINVNLAEHTRLLEGGVGFDRPVEFLSSVLGIAGSPFQTSLLRLAVEKTGNVTVLLDGFDEICSAYEDTGLLLIAGLLGSRVEKLWVTSRHSVVVAVEREMSTFASRLKHFTVEDQTAVILRHWKEEEASCEVRSDEELIKLIAKLLARLSVSLKDREIHFTGIPLQTMMLAEVFSKYAANPSEFQLPKTLDLVYLFEQFIEKKFMVYVRKLWPDTNVKVNRTVLVEMRTAFHEKHVYASLVYLLFPELLEKLDSKDEIISKSKEFMTRVLSGEDKSGIVDGVVNERPKFIHRCFAEFFVAKYFLKSYERNRVFLRDYLFCSQFAVVREMFDRLLIGRRPLHLAVIYNDADLVISLISEGSDVNERDEGGRTALHLAVGLELAVEASAFDGVAHGMPHQGQSSRYQQPHQVSRRLVVNHLLEKGADVLAEDSVLQWTPLQYAVRTGAWDMADILLAAGSDPARFALPADVYSMWCAIIDEGHVGVMKCIVQRGLFVGDDFSNCYVVERSIIRGHLPLVELLVTTREDVLRPRVQGRTLIHQAARCGHRDILDYLMHVVEREVGETGLREGVDLPDDSGDTAACLALENGFLEIARVLLDRGGGDHAVQSHRSRLVETASYQGRLDVVEFVVGGLDPSALRACLESCYGVDMGGVVMVALGGHTHVLRYLVEKGCDVTRAVDRTGVNVLHALVGKGRLADVEFVVESIADGREAVEKFVNATYMGDVTPLHSVSWLRTAPKRDMFEEQGKIVGYLLSKGADLRAVDANGRTPFHWAAGMFACLPVMEALVGSLGRDSAAIRSYVNAKDMDGRTAKDLVQDDQYYILSGPDRRVQVANWLDEVLAANPAVGS